MNGTVAVTVTAVAVAVPLAAKQQRWKSLYESTPCASSRLFSIVYILFFFNRYSNNTLGPGARPRDPGTLG